MEPEGSLLCQRGSAAFLYPELSYSSPHYFIVYFKIPFNIILPSTTTRVSPCPSAFRYQHPECSYLPIHVTHPANLILLESVSLSIQIYTLYRRISDYFWQ
jgi:hypothetical protein